MKPHESCGVYVFLLENRTWKLQGLFDTTLAHTVLRDWDYAPNWLKEIIGELPDDPGVLFNR
jgi:hypothetical protein